MNNIYATFTKKHANITKDMYKNLLKKREYLLLRELKDTDIANELAIIINNINLDNKENIVEEKQNTTNKIKSLSSKISN